MSLYVDIAILFYFTLSFYNLKAFDIGVEFVTDNNIFKDLWDASLYQILYIIIPIIQFGICVTKGGDGRFTCVILMMAGILYDCYTRFNGVTIVGKRKIILIGIPAAIMLTETVSIYIFESNGISEETWAYFLYVPMIIPIIITWWDLVNKIRTLTSV